MTSWTVYCHEHVRTGRCYVGITCGSMGARWAQHVRSSRRFAGRSRFHAALGRLGPDSFSHRVLAEGLSAEEARDLEAVHIVRLDSIAGGFNTRAELVPTPSL